MGALTPIDQVIRTLCRATGEPDFKNYDTIGTHVRGAMVDLNIYVLPSVKSVEMCADQLGNLKWPKDCVKPLMVGVRYKGRDIRNVSIDSIISPASDGGFGSISEVEEDIYNAPGNGEACFSHDGASLQGYGCGYDRLKIATHSKDDRSTNLKFKIRQGTTFLFTYIADGISCGITHIPVEAEVAVEEWVFWKYYKRTDKGLSRESKQNYRDEHVRLRKFYQDQSLEDWIIAIVR